MYPNSSKGSGSVPSNNTVVQQPFVPQPYNPLHQAQPIPQQQQLPTHNYQQGIDSINSTSGNTNYYNYSLFGGGPIPVGPRPPPPQQQQQPLAPHQHQGQVGQYSFFGFGPNPLVNPVPVQVPASYYNAPGPQHGLPPQHVLHPQLVPSPALHSSPFASPFGYNMYPPVRTTPPLPQSTTSSASSDSIPDLKAIEDYIVSLINPNIKSKSEDPKTEEPRSEDQPTKLQTTVELPTPSVPSDRKEPKTQERAEESVTNSRKGNKVYRSKQPTPTVDKHTYYEQLSAEIIVQCNALRPSDSDINKRLQLLARLQKMVHGQWPDANPNLRLFGSSSNAFGFKNADMDVTLAINAAKAGSEEEIVQKLGDILRKKQMRQVKTLPKARVPIVKFTDSTTNISCDICINNLLAPHNTKLLSDYAKIDPRVQQLGYIVKYWAKKRQINEPYQGTLSSYAYILMVIHFLQQRNPPIVPCLQQLHPEEPREVITIAGYDCWYYDKVERLKDFGKPNRETIGELLHAFFTLYACEFDWDNWVVSVRTGKYLTKAEKHWDKKVEDSRDNILFTLEDPFETTHNLGRLVDEENLKIIRYEFERAHRLLTNQDNLKTVCRMFTENEEKL